MGERRPCNSCDGYLEGHEPGGICQSCLDDWARWRRNERESVARYVRQQMGEAALPPRRG